MDKRSFIITIIGGAVLGLVAFLATDAFAPPFHDVPGDISESGIDGGGVAQTNIDMGGKTLGDATDAVVTITAGDDIGLGDNDRISTQRATDSRRHAANGARAQDRH